MEFRILGPLEVVSEQEQLALGGGRQRAVLALLLLRPNEVVSTDKLIDDLWSENTPPSARKLVQLYVSRLRKSLGNAPAADGVILTRPPGYVLRLQPDELDAHRFEQLFEGGRQAMSIGEPALAADTLREALGLWRGPPLADFAYEPFAQTAAGRFEELRLAALEERIEADLALGRHAELIGELEGLIVEHPLRERPRGQLMVALYRAGRQAEALAAYQEARRVLVEGLGIEPSPQLQRVERAILQQQPELDAPAVRNASPVADEEAATLVAPPQRPLAAPGTERKVATALFADLVGSTELGREQDPERTRSLLERLYDAMSSEIESAGGTVEKFAGDAVTAIFGAPGALEDHAERALHAALGMRRRLEEDFEGTLAIRVGIETGEVIVGSPRADSSLVTGNAVHAAARLEQAAEPGEILVGLRAARAAQAAFEIGEVRTVEAKGIPAGLACRPLLGTRPLTANGPSGPGLQRAAFVGRESELELLQATYRRAVRERETHLVTIMGDAGIGKTRLVRELWERLAAEPSEPSCLTGRCLSYGRGITYWPLGEILREVFSLQENEPPETIRERLGDQEMLALTLGIDVGELHPLEARERLHTAWVALLEDRVAERPVVVVVEDLHLAEESLLDLLERLLRDIHGPLLLLGTARPELLDRRSAWAGGRRNAASFWLEPLSPEEAGRLAASLLGGEPSAQLQAVVLERAEGNPFFVEELLAALVDEGVLLAGRDAGRRAAELPSGAAVPDSVQAVLASRIDLLPAAAKSTLQAASVMGRIFWERPLGELLPDVQPDLSILEERDFVRRRPTSSLAGEREFAFKHALTRDVAYGTLPKARRARLHAAFAAWMDVADGRDEHAPLLAYHYAQAARPEDADLAWSGSEDEQALLGERAVTWLRRAADQAVAQGSFAEAVALLEQALVLETRSTVQAELWRTLGLAHALTYDGDGLWTAMRNAIELSSDRRFKAETYAELAYETVIRFGMWKQRPNTELIESWIKEALELAGDHDPAMVRALTARALLDPVKGDDSAREAFGIATSLGDQDLLRLAVGARTEVAMAAERYEDALALVTQVFEHPDERANPDDLAGAHWYATDVHAALGHLDDARRHALRHDEIEIRLGPHHAVHGIGLMLLVEELAGGWETVRLLTPRAERTVSENTTHCAMATRTLYVCAAGYASCGDHDESHRLEGLANALGTEGYGTWVDAPRLRLALVRGDLETARELLESAQLVIGGRLPAQAARLDALAALRDRERAEREASSHLQPGRYLEPFALRTLGIVREDEELVERALVRFRALGLEWHAAQTSRLVARV